MNQFNRRHLLQFTFGAAAAGLLSACAAGSTAKPASQATAQTAPATAGQKVSIEYWQYFFQSKQDLVNSLIQDFQKQNPNIEIVHNSTIPYEQYQQKLAAAAPAGQGKGT